MNSGRTHKCREGYLFVRDLKSTARIEFVQDEDTVDACTRDDSLAWTIFAVLVPPVVGGQATKLMPVYSWSKKENESVRLSMKAL